MPKAFLTLAICLSMLCACTQRMICPAYQSAFIYDQEALRKQFSYFKEDSTPKVYTVSKNRYLMIPEESYRKKIRSMQTIQMKPVYVQLPDSLKPDKEKKKKEEEFAGAETDAADSLATDSTRNKPPEDSTYVITKDKEVRILRYDWDSVKYNVINVTLNADQDNYMWYHRDVLVLPDVRAAMDEQKKTAVGKNATEKKGEKKGFFSFFKNLFKKKSKQDSVAAPLKTNSEPIDEDVAPSDSTAVQTPVQQPAGAPPVQTTPAPAPEKKKGGLFGRKKKNPKTQDPKKDPAKKEGDGF